MKPAKRMFMAVCVLGVLALWGGPAYAADAKATGTDKDSFTFFVIGDPQVNIPRWGTEGTEKTIDIMNGLPGESFPFGGKLDRPRGVLILGDLVDDLHNRRNWARYEKLFAVDGKARLKFPVYECVGNHDLDLKNSRDKMSVIEKALVARNAKRLTRIATCPLGYHYSWDWGSVHFVSMSPFPGNQPRAVYGRAAPWNNPRRSLDFLGKDLALRVGKSGRPVVLMWHYGLVGWGREKWWSPEDLTAMKKAIAPYNVVLILHGHEHAYRKYQWEGYDVLMAPSPQFDRNPRKPETISRPKGFLVIRVQQDQLQAAYRTADGWKAQWSKKIKTGNKLQSK